MKAKLHSLFRPVQGSGRMPSNRYMEFMPSPLLQPYVSCYWASEPVPAAASGLETPGLPDRVLPDGCTDILFEQDLTNHRFRVLYCGLFESPFSIVYDEAHPHFRFGVRFFPGGAHAIMKSSISEFTNKHHDLNDIWPGIADELGERITAETSLAGKIRLMEQFLIGQLHKSNDAGQDDRMNNVLYGIFTSGGTSTVRQLAEGEVLSTRHLHRKFDQWIGVSPKRFSEIVRFQSLVQQIRSQNQGDWASLAVQHGYYDQAHMIHHFKRFYGDSPMVAAREFQSVSEFYNRLSDESGTINL